MIRVLVVDDHPMMRYGLAAVIEAEADLELAGEAADGLEAIAQHRACRPDVTLMDLQMPRLDGIGATVEIIKESPAARILILTTFRGDARVRRALDAGACGYVLKSRMRKEMVEAIRAAKEGRNQIDEELASQVAQQAMSVLTPRELDVIERVARGSSNKVIGFQLGITEDTVKSYMKSVLAKLQAKDRAHAVTIAYERGILDRPQGR